MVDGRARADAGSIKLAIRHARGSHLRQHVSLAARPVDLGAPRDSVLLELARNLPMSTAILLCDLWDCHWCSTAAVGTARIARRAASLAASFRSRGGVVIHATSDTMGFYLGHPAREYVLSLLAAEATRGRPTDLGPPPDVPFPPAGRPCPDLPECAKPSGPPWPWTRQHPAIEIDPADAVLDGGEEMLAVVADRNIEHVFVAGVHTNLCVVQRPFGIAALRGAGIPCSLLGDLTEAMPPAFTDAALDHIDRYFCPVISSDEIV